MTSNEIRLECLKLRHRHDKEPFRIIEEAKQFEQYITGGLALSPAAETDANSERRKPGRPKKIEVGNVS